MLFDRVFNARYSLICGVLVLAVGCKSSTSTLQPHLTEPLKFAHFTTSEITPERAKNLRSAKVYIGTETPEAEDYDWLQSKTGSKLHVETVNQYLAAKAKYYPATTKDMEVQQWFDSVSDTLDFLAKAKPSQYSYFGEEYLKELPVSILKSGLCSVEKDVADQYEKLLDPNMTLMDYTKGSAPIHLRNLRQTGTLTFSDNLEIDYCVKELARGDVDGDGCEDALVRIGWHTKGTMGGTWTCIVTKTLPNQKPQFAELRE